MSGYRVKEIYATLQGEGAQSGRAAVFLRFTGCNLWSGREEDRATATCRFCDTDFVGTDGPGGGRFSNADSLADTVEHAWQSELAAPATDANRLVVCTGGEPLLQLDAALLDALHARGFEIAVETNGTRPLPAPGNRGGLDWITVSPKAGAPLALTSGDELKLVFPQPTLMPDAVAGLDFTHFFLQPMDGPKQIENIQAAIAFCQAHPRWRLSLQTHKLVGLA
ncbi:MAG: 7-carboxy-7-deazaguanine synthase [Planctomycetota bacterium]